MFINLEKQIKQIRKKQAKRQNVIENQSRYQKNLTIRYLRMVPYS